MRRHILVRRVSLGVCISRHPPKGIHIYGATSSKYQHAEKRERQTNRGPADIIGHYTDESGDMFFFFFCPGR